MPTNGVSQAGSVAALTKVPTGIQGLDEITLGGLPASRATLLCGGPGCGKTVLSMEFLVRGATEYGEPGLLLAFEERREELVQNLQSLAFDLPSLIEKKLLHVSAFRLDQADTVETGEFSLDGLLVHVDTAISAMGIKRVVIDSVDSLFENLSATRSLRRELTRVLESLKSRGVTTVVTSERGSGNLTRHGFEEYSCDCVMLLDHRVVGNISKRRLRVIKYRGSAHGGDEYPFVIGASGISVFPITSVQFPGNVSSERQSTGIEGLDAMFGSQGYYRGSVILVSGTAGTGKSTMAAAFASAMCRAGSDCLYFAFEEPADQIVRNMRSVGFDLSEWIKVKKLTIHSARATLHGLEEHLVHMVRAIDERAPAAVIIDPITSFAGMGGSEEVKSMLMRVLDHLKSKQITVLLTSLTPGTVEGEYTDARVSSMVDTWIVLDRWRRDGNQTRSLYIAKSRGMEHSNQVAELILSAEGIRLDVGSRVVAARSVE